MSEPPGSRRSSAAAHSAGSPGSRRPSAAQPTGVARSGSVGSAAAASPRTGPVSSVPPAAIKACLEQWTPEQLQAAMQRVAQRGDLGAMISALTPEQLQAAAVFAKRDQKDAAAARFGLTEPDPPAGSVPAQVRVSLSEQQRATIRSFLPGVPPAPAPAPAAGDSPRGSRRGSQPAPASRQGSVRRAESRGSTPRAAVSS
eukprot:TRINITY_DN7396_c0_g2_i1.p2 TRINITY_DN7396_c0_g2~~TRINITY_DN7396_c0_g2_i1.p2  ORF type:complete len:221 (+),score=56.75 TRINITY_DN7396_c0_g2_i1:66-665(+)